LTFNKAGSTKQMASPRRRCRGRCELLSTRTTLRSSPHEPGSVKTHALRFALPLVRSAGRHTHLPAVQRVALEQPRHLLFGGLQATRFSAASSATHQPGCDQRSPSLRRQRLLAAHTIYECPSCDERFVGERRCPSCQLFCRALGVGGQCPECDHAILLTELIDEQWATS
jgi:hypothetical protein